MVRQVDKFGSDVFLTCRNLTTLYEVSGTWMAGKLQLLDQTHRREVGIFPLEPSFLGSRIFHEFPHTPIYYPQSF